ncbi:hypothetical protein [Sphingobacterium populi]|nr:hypothetical protein [Sphingobacterium sp. CFCC 11742]
MKTQIISSVIALAAMCTWATAQVQHNNTKREKKNSVLRKIAAN